MLGPWLVLLLYSTVMLTCAEWCWSNVCHSMCRMTRRPAPWAVSSCSSCSSSASWSALAVLSLVSTKQKQPANQRTKISSFSSCYKIILFYFQESWSTRISKRILENVSTENFRLAVKKTELKEQYQRECWTKSVNHFWQPAHHELKAPGVKKPHAFCTFLSSSIHSTWWEISRHCKNQKTGSAPHLLMHEKLNLFWLNFLR